MSTALITLGGIPLEAFEVPSLIRFGGRQQVVVHQLIGGARVIDCLGPNDSVIRWPGIFTGPDASDRARMLDAMRSAGDVLQLSWDAFCYQVVIESLDLRFFNPWWIQYDIACAVSADLAQPQPTATPDDLASIEADLSAAAQFADVSAASAAVATSGALIAGTTPFAQANAAVSTAFADVESTISTSGVALASTSLQNVVSNAGTLAQYAIARLYIARAAVNLGNADE